MGHLDRRGDLSSLFKMDMITWLTLLIGVITFATPAQSNEPRVVCYYTNWSVYRPGNAKFNPQNINPYLCTHLIYAFGGFTKDNTLKPFDKYQDIEKGGYAKFTGLKTYNKNLKTMLAIGGWNEGSSRFSPMVGSRERRREFVRNAIKFLRQNRFDGLDLDWEYPAFRDGGKPKDREHYAKLVKELREEFEKESSKTGKPRLLLTMAVPAGIEYIQKGFDLKTLNQYLDWMNLLTYDYHSAFEPAVNHHAPLYPLEEPNEYSVDTELNIDYTIKFYLENGADANKLVLGIPTYGRSYTLFNADAVEIGSPADGPGEQGDATREKGYLAYYEICEALKPKAKKRSTEEDSDEYSEEEEEEEWTVMHPNPEAMGPVAFKGNQWVGYDDEDIVKKKAEYVAENGLGGIMFWSIDNDDFRGTCHNKPYPLIEAAKDAYLTKLDSTDNTIAVKSSKPSRTSGNRRRNRPKSTTTTPKPSTKSNKRKSSSTTPSWNITPEPPTTPDPGSDFKCVDEGFYPHPRDCKKYFWCLDSGPSDLGIVAHQFTCPSGLFFNKAADSCDFARNVLCKMPAATTKAPATRAPTTTTIITTTTTTRKPIKLSTKNSAAFRTTSSTTLAPESESEEYEYISSEENLDEDAEDPRVIKELIDLIKKVGGIEQLEKQLHLSETSASTDGGSTTTPTPFNKKLYQKVLERAREKSRYNTNSILQTSTNSRRGPQNQGLDAAADKDVLIKKDRPQYTTINRQRAVVSTTEEPPSVEEDSEEDQPQPAPSRGRAVEQVIGTTAKPLQYVNIRRARPSSSDTADDTASRNALFERAESYVAVTELNTLDIAGARRENVPEYVTIRRQRPTTEETTTVQYQEREPEIEQGTALEREISSQPQYTSIVRARSTTVTVPDEPSTTDPSTPRYRSTTALPEEPSTPEPTTVLAVQISSLLNTPSFEDEAPETTVVLTTEQTTTTSTTTTTTTTTPAPPSSTRRNLIGRRRLPTTTSTTPAPGPSSSTTQVSARNYTFVRRRRPLLKPNEISDSDVEVSRKIRSTTPNSREVDDAKTVVPSRGRTFRRYQAPTTPAEDSVPAAAVSRGQFRPRISPDEILSLTPVDVEPQFVPRQSFSSRTGRRFQTRPTVADVVSDSEASAATVQDSRPSFAPRGRSRYTLSTGTFETDEPTTEYYTTTEPSPSTFSQRRPTFARFSPRPFGRASAVAAPVTAVEDNNQAATEVTQRTPIRLSYGRPRFVPSTAVPVASTLQARRLPFRSRFVTTPRALISTVDDDDEPESKTDDIHLSESTIEEKEHLEEDNEEEKEVDEAPKRRIVVKKLKAPVATEEIVTEAVPVDDSGKKRFRIIRRRPATTTVTPTETVYTTEPLVSQTPRIRKVIRKKINRLVDEEPDIIAKSIGSVETLKITSTAAPSTRNIINYGERKRFTTSTTTTTTPTPTTTQQTTTTEQVTESIIEEVTEAAKKEVLTDVRALEEKIENSADENVSIKEVKEIVQEEQIVTESENTENQNTRDQQEEKRVEEEIVTKIITETEVKPEVVIETEQKAIDLSETQENTSEEVTTTESIDTTLETTTTTTTTTASPSPTPRARLPFRSQKRLFTSTTESIPSSSRTFSRKYNPGAYTSPATISARTPLSFRPSVTRRPALFTRRPFTTARTTTKLEEEYEEDINYSDDEVLDEEPENAYQLVPSSQLFTRKPEDNDDDLETEDETSDILEDGEEYEPEEENKQGSFTTKNPFRPRLINSNTFRTSTSTTALPKRFGSTQNRTVTIYNRFSSIKSVNNTKKRVVNVPLGYTTPVAAITPKINETQDIKEVTTDSVIETETTTDDDYLSMSETTATLPESTNTDTLVTNTNEAETATAEMEISTNDYLESIDQTTNYPSTQYEPVYVKTTYQNPVPSYVITTQNPPETTTVTVNAPVSPIVKTQYNKLFSVSRVVEVSSKLDKHRLNKNNETTLIEEGKVIVEKKPVVDKIGEVSRFSLIKIVEDEIPIYLTKLGHVYPVENPPDNLIIIDEARNARALNYIEPPRENLVASESVNEAYRIKETIDDISKSNNVSEVELIPRDDFLRYVNFERSSDKVEEIPFTQWQFVPAAYEKEENKKDTSETVTLRSMLTHPSTLSLEGLFKTETPISARTFNKDPNQPFVVYSASVPTQQEEANIVKLDVLKPESGRSILTFAKGQEFNGAPIVEENTAKSPIIVSILPSTESTISTFITEKPTSPILDMLSKPTVTELPTMTTVEETITTDTVPEETTTVKLSPVELKRAKYGGFPRRPIIKTGNLTRVNVPRTISSKKVNVTSVNFQKANKTVPFSPNKSRFSVSRSQNVPVDIRNKTSKTPKVYTTDSPTQRKIYGPGKAPRPTFRPTFLNRRTTLPPTTGDS